MIDIHCHLLPEVDDGAKSWAIAQEMCRIAANDGITHIVATPHANDTYVYDPDLNQATLARLRELAGNTLQFSLGCDFHFSYDNLQQAQKEPGRYAIAGSPYLLTEFSDFGLSPQVSAAISRLRSTGVIPIVTHPERNLLMQRNPEQVLGLIDGGCAVQVTASALTGQWGETARRTAHWLLERDAVHVLASDAHDDRHRPPLLSPAREAVAKLCGPDVARALVQENPAAIIAGQPLPYWPAPRPKPAKAAFASGLLRRK
ncbi:MAG TPA: CpsB/CapC family capsule biosynthesis tyrosine phosphatase [Terriglobales bacterium]|jgi:protein-tyrosine phosphatase|nr:CpsB/CapC family capsule biosynthesis tyrosine phosphatase [Terriglobales bacterium]